MDMDQHSFRVDIGDLQVKSFLESQPEGVDDREEAVHGRFFDQFQKGVDFTDREDDRYFLFDFDAGQLECFPIARNGESEELLEGLLSHVDGAGAPLFGIDDMEQVASEVVFGGGGGIFGEEFVELS